MRSGALCLLVLLWVAVVAAILPVNVHSKLYAFYDTHGAHEKAPLLLVLKEKANIVKATENLNNEEKGFAVFKVLSETASTTQKPVIEVLKRLDATYTPYWLVNMIAVEANYSSLLELASHPAIHNIDPNFQFRVELEEPETEADLNVTSPNAIEWNVARVRAPEVWALGFNGTGQVVANADTGVQWDHPALIQQYRGWTSGTTGDHNYNWWDAIHATGSRCGASSRVPCDDNGHGTHTTGTAVGFDHNTNQIGVAPAAKWIACRNMNAGLGTPQTYIECLQFFVAPTDLNGANPDPARRPHAIGNSYGCPPSEGCNVESLRDAVKNTIAAGIFLSVSAGNSGPSCSTVSDPPALYVEVFSVGALAYQSATIASYSSRGPVTINGVSIPKPEISAPGSTVRSSYPTTTYTSLSGTSMASPHITGIVPLLWQAKPTLSRDIASTVKVLTATAIRRESTACGSGDGWNNVYGYGEVDIYAAVTSA